MMNNEMTVEPRFERLEYLLETTTLGADPENLLNALVNSMSDREFHEAFMFLCRMHDIEPDMEKFNKQMEDEQYDLAVERPFQGN